MDLDALWTTVLALLGSDRVADIMQAILKVGLGLLLARLLSAGAVRLFIRSANAHQAMLVRRVAFYTVLSLFTVSALTDLGFNFGVLLGAAGILTVALGFASQTSASNVISGLFLLGEKAFSVGDIIRIGTTTGEVLSIDLLSVKLRTFDNLFVRIPNETLVKAEITNLTRFPIRRLDIVTGVAYKEDLNQVQALLRSVADHNPLCLQDPEPLFIFQGFGDSALNFQFSVWTLRENYLDLRNGIQIEIKEAFDSAGIEIPFPHRTLYTGSSTEPFPVRVVADGN